MIYLLLAILSSVLISVIMRLSAAKVTGNISMLAMNYLTCLSIAAGFAGIDRLWPADAALPETLGMGAVHGGLYLFSFVLFQRNVQKNGMVLSSVFMKLGLLVPLVASIFLFSEMPTPLQWVGFSVAIASIILINRQDPAAKTKMGAGLLILLLAGGAGDAMSKVYEEWGAPHLADSFLLYTFATALLLCIGLMVFKKQTIGRYELLFGCLIGIPNFFSAKFLLQSLNTLPAVIVYPTFSVGTILVVTLVGILLFKERLTARQWVAIGGILAALVMLNV